MEGQEQSAHCSWASAPAPTEGAWERHGGVGLRGGGHPACLGTGVGASPDVGARLGRCVRQPWGAGDREEGGLEPTVSLAWPMPWAAGAQDFRLSGGCGRNFNSLISEAS